MDIYDTIIIGVGPAGLSAGMYAGRFKLKTLIFGSDFGGSAGTAGVIYNYPGVKNIDGYDLVKTMKEQAIENGAIFIDENVSQVEKEGELFKVFVDDKIYLSKTLILATGSERKKLDIANEKEFEGKGVHYCVTCDGPAYVDKNIAIIGGGYAAVKNAILASQYAKKVYILARGKELKAEAIMLDALEKIGEKIEVVTDIKVEELKGDNKLEGIILSKEIDGSNELKLDAIFVEIGSSPSNQIAKSLGITLDEKGYVITDSNTRTNVDGIFVIGDLSNLFGSFKQNITAAAMGALSANSAYQYIKGLK